jgi:hypothetical protein
MSESNREVAEAMAVELLVEFRAAQRDGRTHTLWNQAERIELAKVFAHLADLDQYQPVADKYRSNAELWEVAHQPCPVCGSTDPGHLAALDHRLPGGLSVVDVPLPDQAEGDKPEDLGQAGSCAECGTPDLLGHKLNCSGATL